MIRALCLVAALVSVGCGHSSSSAGGGGFDSGLPTCSGEPEAGAACTAGVPRCFDCVSGDGFECSCEDDSGLVAEDAGAIWVCVGTGYTCP
jgi:hypothetical protein